MLTPGDVQEVGRITAATLREMDRILLGRQELHRLVLVGIFSRGHILLEGLPGLGKTALVKTLGAILKLPFKRVQFTPDLMPGDILGAHILQAAADGRRQMEFQPGPVFTNILLADEINRASPKTQSAMLETMQERCVTLLGVTRPLPHPFFVLASQNPIELEGTYPLPEAQLDRFLFKLSVGEVSVEVMESIITQRRRGEAPEPEWRLGEEELGRVFAAMDRVFLPPAVARYVARLVAATHGDHAEAPEIVRQYVTYGASPRAAIAIAEAARAHALIAGRPTVGFEDVQAVAVPALNHRIILNYRARIDKVGALDLVAQVLKAMDPVGMALPAGVQVSAP